MIPLADFFNTKVVYFSEANPGFLEVVASTVEIEPTTNDSFVAGNVPTSADLSWLIISC